MKSLLLSFIILSIYALPAQQASINISDLTIRNIGPANQGGRIVDIEAHEDDFTKVYVATASGGVWKSTNAGTTWQSIFDDYGTASIGDIAIDQSNKDFIWVGTGESNNRNSVSWGNGIYKSLDGGSTFQNMGLQSTHQIARVLVHPDDSEDVCACAIGHLWGYSGERGLYNTKDGGVTWTKMTNGLPNDGKTGCIDVVRDSQHPDIMYAAFYHRLRQPWHFHSGDKKGEEGHGGIYKSKDNGASWQKLTNGLPSGPMGRIGLAIYKKNPNIVMAIIEAEKTDTLDIPGTGIYRSENGGAQWDYVNTYNYRPFYYSQIRINPYDDQRVYVLTTRFMVSEDGGKTLKNGSEDQEIHGDFHAQWFDPNYKDRYYLGADKGLSLTHDHGAHFQLMDNMPIGQFYRIGYDMQDPYYVHGGLQDNGSYAIASFSRDARGILNDDNWKMHWGDGQDVVTNPYDHTETYSSMENGSYMSYHPETHDIRRISPAYNTTSNYKDYFSDVDTDLESVQRFNWSAPLVMSPHNPSTLYVAGNHVYKSTDKGNSWQIISPDLSTNDALKSKANVSGGVTPDNTGAETHCSIHSLSVSPISEQIIWVGTDDGNVQCTLDGGSHWMNVRENIPDVPKDLWVSRVEASHFQSDRAYVTFDGHRSDDFGTWIFVTDDNGKHWRKITVGISNGETVRVIREDYKNPNLLFIGTETGVWYTLDRGLSWTKLSGLPTVSVYDLKIHPRDNDLIIGTHGRSIWIMDDISPLQEMPQISDDAAVYLFNQKEVTLWHNVSRGGQRGHFWYAGENPPNIQNISSLPRARTKTIIPISFYLGDDIDNVQLKIADYSGSNIVSLIIPTHSGINRYFWNGEFESKPYTIEEEAEIEFIFNEILATNSSSSIRRMYNSFQSAKTPYLKRKAIEPLTGGYLSYPIPYRFTVPKVREGIYKIEITSEGITKTGTISIRKDPMEN